jgi:spermidine synthase
VGVVARAESERGEVVLRRRVECGALELRVNGVFVMDDRETSTERLLARTTIEALASRAGDTESWRVMVGGLGLGYTLAELLTEPRVASVLVAEIEPDLVGWHHEGLVPGSPLVGDAADRVEVSVGDVRDVVAGLPQGSVDLILLDVDNGPDFLVYDANAAVYQPPFLIACRDALAPDGLVAIWSADSSPALTANLETVFGSTRELALPVTLQTRLTTYHLFLALPVERRLWRVEP